MTLGTVGANHHHCLALVAPGYTDRELCALGSLKARRNVRLLHDFAGQHLARGARAGHVESRSLQSGVERQRLLCREEPD
jgi:hypothetical protein